jgi:hypothetical protein
MAAKHKSFDDWSAQEVRLTFDIEATDSSELLTSWLSKVITPSQYVAEVLEEKRLILSRYFRSWNEDELKFQFIAHIVELAKLRGKRFSTFSQRILTAKPNNILLNGKPEVMVAMGIEEPISPYFFIHEYKPTKSSGDPLGQVLSAMVAAQYLNKDDSDRPVLGCFILSNTWQFLVLEGKTYTVSRAYNATENDDLTLIYAALCQAKVYIEGWVNSSK